MDHKCNAKGRKRKNKSTIAKENKRKEQEIKKERKEERKKENRNAKKDKNHEYQMTISRVRMLFLLEKFSSKSHFFPFNPFEILLTK